MSCFLRSNGPTTTLNLVSDIAICNSSSRVAVEEMFRETLQTLACLSVLASTYSLHMPTRDSYRGPLVDRMNLAQYNDPINDAKKNTKQQEMQQSQQPKLNIATNSNTQEQQQQLILDDNEIPDYNGIKQQPPIGPLLQPHGLQELFGTATKYDIRMQQQQHDLESAALSPNKRAPGTPAMLPTMSHGIASQLMLRSARGQRQYDVPQIGKYTFHIKSYSLQVW